MIKYFPSPVIFSFQDVENEKPLSNLGDIDTGNSEEDDARDTADYQRIATIYEAISQYRSELRKLQTLQRQDIRLNIKSSKPKVNTKDYHFSCRYLHMHYILQTTKY